MIASLNAAVDIGAVGCRLLNSDFSVQTSCVQPFPTIINQLFSIDLLRQYLPTLALWGMQPLFSQDLESAEVDTVSALASWLSGRFIREVNGFSSEYFMYAEEVNLCHKIRLAGRRVHYCARCEGDSLRRSEYAETRRWVFRCDDARLRLQTAEEVSGSLLC